MSRRFEIKVPIPLNRLQMVENWLMLHPQQFKTHHPDRYVNSLYLDSPDFRRFEENLSGISQRRKTRIRWYGDLANPKESMLEFKYRRGGKGSKCVYPLDVDWSQHSSWQNLLDSCRRQLPLDAQVCWECENIPVLISRYRRRYLISTCGNIRATFDDEMQCYDQRYSNKMNIQKGRSLGDYVLLEIKTNAEHESALSQLIATCPLRPSRHSKYVNGIRQIIWY
ncbi:polyphosphate polymerase domain-containing protein [Vibrio zhanjiangensis]|uniref:polyphosphate polymerase domain-containing protein n=1 Tax=Vibrio zhanjiangensis TaxID=1046128 RepID=UPI0024E177DC|nr:polyphosphate polymerase domain-containing protein [Vibrio zhanjiangensis]